VEAVVLGAQWVLVHADEGLARAAADVLAKVSAVIPERLRAAIDEPAVITPPAWGERLDAGVDVARLRAWSLQGRKLRIRYADAEGRSSERTVWPFLVGYFEQVRTLIAWCELRGDFRMFRTDRLRGIDFLEERYPERRATLRRRWLAMMAERRAAAQG
jgi:predicted DNA-binding transcriptional regulator YafY